MTLLTDGRTKNKWDAVIPLEPLWEQYKRIIKPNGAICLFADGMFMSTLMASNNKMWRYNLIWDKVLTSGFLNANRMPLRRSEEIVVFYKKQPTYHPQKIKGQPNHSKGKSVNLSSSSTTNNNNYGDYTVVDNSQRDGCMKHPSNILRFSKPHPSVSLHPTEKPVELLEWLIKSYTDPGDTVLDNCMGSGSTGVACVNTDRNFIGIEQYDKYFEIAKQRITEKYNKLPLHIESLI